MQKSTLALSLFSSSIEVMKKSIRIQLLLTGITLLLLASCSSIPTSKPLAPKVTVAGVTPLNLSLTDTKLNFTLRVENPNTYDLPLQNLEFAAFFAGKQIATGLTNEAVTIPANGEAMMDIAVTAGLSKIFGQLKSMLEEQQFDLNYNVVGKVKLKNWPTRIPFNVEGEFEQPDLGTTE